MEQNMSESSDFCTVKSKGIFQRPETKITGQPNSMQAACRGLGLWIQGAAGRLDWNHFERPNVSPSHRKVPDRRCPPNRKRTGRPFGIPTRPLEWSHFERPDVGPSHQKTPDRRCPPNRKPKPDHPEPKPDHPALVVSPFFGSPSYAGKGKAG